MKANTSEPYYGNSYIIVRKSDHKRIKDLVTKKPFPIFNYAIQALKYAEGKGINREIYEIKKL